MARDGLREVVRGGFLHVDVHQHPGLRTATDRAVHHRIRSAGHAAQFDHDRMRRGVSSAWRVSAGSVRP